jgi:5-methylcytosine-specific restriction endonuclease McrA
MVLAMNNRKQWQKWYKTTAWRALRLQVLAERPLCIYCEQLGITKAADTVDHIKPHRGDPMLFWSVSNLQPLCKLCHDSHKQRKEKSGILVGSDVDGWPVDPDSHWHK